MNFFKVETKKLFGIFTNPTLIYVTIVGNFILLIATYVLYRLELGINPNIHGYFDSLWWGMATITTVAYGDVVPVTVAGRIVGMVLMYTGTVMFVTFTGIILSLLLQEEVEREISPLQQEIKDEGIKQIYLTKTLKEIKNRLDKLQRKGVQHK